MIHLVDDSFVMLKSFYLLDASSTTGFFIFFDGGLGKPQIHRLIFCRPLQREFGGFFSWLELGLGRV
jgi:hypothetical protein